MSLSLINPRLREDEVSTCVPRRAKLDRQRELTNQGSFSVSGKNDKVLKQGRVLNSSPYIVQPQILPLVQCLLYSKLRWRRKGSVGNTVILHYHYYHYRYHYLHAPQFCFYRHLMQSKDLSLVYTLGFGLVNGGV